MVVGDGCGRWLQSVGDDGGRWWEMMVGDDVGDTYLIEDTCEEGVLDAVGVG